MSVDFDKIVTKTVSGAKVVYKKAGAAVSDAADFTKAQIERAALRDKIKDRYNELGKLCYAKFTGGEASESDMKRIVGEIDKLIANMKETDTIVSKNKSKICDFCKTKNDLKNVYCAKCGEKL
jgi:hypothetical protein